MTLLTLGAWCLILGGVIFLLWRTGLLAVIRGFLLLVVPTAVPARTRTEAELAAEAFDSEDPAKPETIVPAPIREATAARRATDPAFDRAFRRRKVQLKKGVSA